MHKKPLVWMGIALLLLSLTACAETKELKKKKAEAARKVGEAHLQQENYLRECSKGLMPMSYTDECYTMFHCILDSTSLK